MKKRTLLMLLAVSAAAVAAGLAVFLSSRPAAAETEKESPALPCVRIAAVYAALTEKPDAKTVLLAGRGAGAYRGIFERAGLVCATDGRGPFDLVFATVPRAADGKAVEATLAAGGVLVECIDARGIEAPRLWETLRTFPAGGFRFWMPGEFDWLVVGRRGSGTVDLAAMMDLFAREESFADLSAAGCDSLPTLFAAYVGSDAEVMPAFNGAVGAVRADNFVTRRTPPLPWISAAGVDADIASAAFSAMRAAQIVRRMVLAGNLYAARGDEKKAVETWARAAARAPGDSLIVERLHRLDVNGKVFLQLGKAAMAARCYETMAQIRPDDPAPVRRYGECLQKLGKNDVAVRAFARARAMEKKNRKGKDRPE